MDMDMNMDMDMSKDMTAKSASNMNKILDVGLLHVLIQHSITKQIYTNMSCMSCVCVCVCYSY